MNFILTYIQTKEDLEKIDNEKNKQKKLKLKRKEINYE